jgi:hypothetical protein
MGETSISLGQTLGNMVLEKDKLNGACNRPLLSIRYKYRGNTLSLLTMSSTCDVCSRSSMSFSSDAFAFFGGGLKNESVVLFFVESDMIEKYLIN